MTLEKVIAILAEYKECDPQEIHENSTFEELEMDSLDTVDLMMTFEDEFGVQLEMSEDIKTVRPGQDPSCRQHRVSVI